VAAGRLSLRARLVVGVLGVVAAGLVASAVVTFAALDRFLQQRLDEQLMASRGPMLEELARGEVFRELVPPATGSGLAAIPTGTYGELRRWWGAVTRYSAVGQPPPVLGARPPGGGSPSTVGSQRSGYAYRLLTTQLNRQGDVLLVALPLEDLRATRGRLLAVEGVVVATLLVLTGLLGLSAVRVGLRPLDEIAATAGAIARGDLGRRVTPADERTEVGRLGLALNGMLAQIERSFEARRRSEERLRRFVADASHELRTPLTSIRGYAELFSRGAAERPGDLAVVLRRIEEESARMGQLVDDLLLLARLDEHRPVEQATIDLARLVRDAADDFRAGAPAHVVELRVDKPAWVQGDEAGLRQVLANLLTNARVHTPDATTVQVALTTVGGGGGDGGPAGPDRRVRLTVADDGPGVPPELAPTVFERFVRAGAGRTRATGGTGLGLAIVQAVVEAHGGSVALEPGPGARFVVDLPAVLAPPTRAGTG